MNSMMRLAIRSGFYLVTGYALISGVASAQSPQPYPNAIISRSIISETPMTPPDRNKPFKDPDFGSLMVRVTDEKTDLQHPGGFLRTEEFHSNEWSADGRKFYVEGEQLSELVFSFDPSSMLIGSLPGVAQGQGLSLPLAHSPSFSLVDPDLIYGVAPGHPFTIDSYRFSTGVVTPVIDTSRCGLQPPLARKAVSDPGLSLSTGDERLLLVEGGPEAGDHMFVVVYDKKLGCRWYNTETGQIGGEWGLTGHASTTASFLSGHSSLSKSGNYVRIQQHGIGYYVWDLATLQVTECSLYCLGYGAVGYDSYINALGYVDQMNIGKRSLADINNLVIPLVHPLPVPHYFGQDRHFSWNNAEPGDLAPICASSYYYDDADDGWGVTTQPYQGEIFCVATGPSSTVWRFAHNRATYIDPFLNTQPLGTISPDGRFFIFTSDWDSQLGTETDGTPRSDVWIVKLD